MTIPMLRQWCADATDVQEDKLNDESVISSGVFGIVGDLNISILLHARSD